MGHRHFCDVAGHWWECEGKALRGDAEPSICICLPCGRPLEGFDHSGCADPVELVACPEHQEEERRSIEEARKQYGQRAAESGEADAALASAGGSATPAEVAAPAAGEPARPFERFPLVPIEAGDPLWHCDWCCHCGCRRMPRELSGGFCFHCGHVYQRNDPEYWLGEEYPYSEAAHLKNCASYREYSMWADEGYAKFRAMIKGADDQTVLKLFAACYSKALDDCYEFYMSAPEGSPERAAIVERVVIASGIEARQVGPVDAIREGSVVPVALRGPRCDALGAPFGKRQGE